MDDPRRQQSRPGRAAAPRGRHGHKATPGGTTLCLNGSLESDSTPARVHMQGKLGENALAPTVPTQEPPAPCQHLQRHSSLTWATRMKPCRPAAHAYSATCSKEKTGPVPPTAALGARMAKAPLPLGTSWQARRLTPASSPQAKRWPGAAQVVSHLDRRHRSEWSFCGAA